MIRLEIIHIGFYILEVLIPEPNHFEVTFKNLDEDEEFEEEFDTFPELAEYIDDFSDYFDSDEMDKFKAMLTTYQVV